MNAQVITNFAKAAVPVSEAAKTLSAAAEANRAKNKDSGKTGIKALAAGRSDEYRMNPFDLQIKEGWNSREMDDPENHAHIDRLARSIASEGVHTALKVFWENGAAFVVDGHMRLLATLRAINVYNAAVETIPVKNLDKTFSEVDRLMLQETGNSGKTFSPIERGTLFKKLLNLGVSEATIAERAGLSVTQVNNLLTLQAAPGVIQQMVKAGQISATTATIIVKDSASDEEAVKKVQEALAAAQAHAQTKGKTKGDGVAPVKVTAKHINSQKLSPRKALKAALEASVIKHKADKVIVEIPAAEFATIQELLKLKNGEA